MLNKILKVLNFVIKLMAQKGKRESSKIGSSSNI